MKNGRALYSGIQRISSVFMILTLAWLTISLPFAAAAKQQIATTQCSPTDKSGDNNPFGNTTEEKAPSGSVVTVSEEYLHHSEELFHSIEIILTHTSSHEVSEYVAFHGELLCPPPNC